MCTIFSTSVVMSVIAVFSITAFNENCESVCNHNEDCLRVCSQPLIASKTSPMSDQSCGITSFDSRRANKGLGRILSGELAGLHNYPWFASLQLRSNTDREDINNLTKGINQGSPMDRPLGGV